MVAVKPGLLRFKSNHTMEQYYPTKAAQIDKSVSFFSQVAATIDKMVAGISRDNPTVLHPDNSGQSIVIYHGFGAPETGRWIELSDGTRTVARSSDIVHVLDEKTGQLVERGRVNDHPSAIKVYPEGAPLPD